MRKTAANVEMQGIEFQIVNDSSSASKGLDSLSASLNRLKSNLGGAGSSLNKTAAGITAIKNSLNKMNTGNFESQLQRISKGLEALNTKTAGMKISSSIGKQISAIGEALNGIKWTDGDKLAALADGLRPLGELGRASLTSFINQLGKLPEVIQQLEAADVDKFADQMERLAAAMKPFADEMAKVSSGFSSFPSKIQKLVASTEQYNGTVQKATTRTNLWGSALKKLSIGVVFRAVSKLLASSMKRASDYQETLAMFGTSMGEYAEEAYSYAQKVNEVMGINPAEWMQSQGVFQSIITGFGIAGDKAAIMSKNLTQLGYDLSAFYNTDVTSAMQKVQSGISGELEPLRRLGYDLSVARLQQEALNLGIKKSVSEMTQAEKAQLRYHAMLTQVTHVQGALARELDSPTNQLRILREQIEQTAQAIGNIFIPILNAVLPVAIAVARAIREIVTAIASLFGIQMAEAAEWDDSAGVSGSGEIAENMDDAAGSAKEMKKFLMGIDELNLIPDQSESGSGSGAGGGSSFDLEPLGYDFLDGAITDRIDAIKEKLEPFVNWVIDAVGRIKARIDETISKIDFEKLLSGLEPLSAGFTNFIEAIAGFASMLYDELLEPVFLWIVNEFAPVVMSSFGEILNGLGEAIGFLQPVIEELITQVITPAILTALDLIKDVVDALGNLGDIIAGASEFIAALVTGDFEQIDEGLERMLTGAQNLVLGLVNAVQNMVNSIFDWFIDIADKTLGSEFAGVLKELKNQVNGVYTFVKNIVTTIYATVKNLLSGVINFIGGVFTADWKRAWEGLKTIVKSIFTGIAGIFASVINVAIRALNRIQIDIPDWVPLIGGQHFGINIQEVSVPKLADGGVVDSGQLFIAREAGAEMVGAVGRKTAVANNDQIVDAVKAGVYEAVVSAMNNSNRDSEQQEIRVYLDSKEISAGLNRRNRMYGVALAGT